MKQINYITKMFKQLSNQLRIILEKPDIFKQNNHKQENKLCKGFNIEMKDTILKQQSKKDRYNFEIGFSKKGLRRN